MCVCETYEEMENFYSFNDCRRGVEQACRAPLNKALCNVLRISLEMSSDVPAQLGSPVVQGLLPFTFLLQSVRVIGNRLSLEPARRFVFALLFCTVVAICKFLDKERVSFQYIPFSTGCGDDSFHCFSGPFSDLLLSV